MRVEAIGNSSYVSVTQDVEAVKQALQKLADQYHVSVDDLLQAAKSAGDAALPYQTRALNLEKRIEKLSKE